MATECRETKKKISKHKVVKVQAYVVLLLLEYCKNTEGFRKRYEAG